jgi:hypothetical protein
MCATNVKGPGFADRLLNLGGAENFPGALKRARAELGVSAATMSRSLHELVRESTTDPAPEWSRGNRTFSDALRLYVTKPRPPEPCSGCQRWVMTLPGGFWDTADAAMEVAAVLRGGPVSLWSPGPLAYWVRLRTGEVTVQVATRYRVVGEASGSVRPAEGPIGCWHRLDSRHWHRGWEYVEMGCGVSDLSFRLYNRKAPVVVQGELDLG